MLVGVGLGMVMPPTQVAVQAAAGRAALGVASRDDFAESRDRWRHWRGGAGRRAVRADGPRERRDGCAAARAMEGGAAYIAAMSTAERAELAAGVDDAYRIVFLVIAAITAIGATIAATVPRTEWGRRAGRAARRA